MRQRPNAAAASLDATLAALADPARRRLVELLLERPHRPGELAKAMRLPPPAVSKHLRVLRRGGLIEEQRVDQDARRRLYRLRAGPFDELESWLRRVRGFWSGQLDAFRQHVERSKAERN